MIVVVFPFAAGLTLGPLYGTTALFFGLATTPVLFRGADFGLETFTVTDPRDRILTDTPFLPFGMISARFGVFLYLQSVNV